MDQAMVNNAAAIIEIMLQGQGPAAADNHFEWVYTNWTTMHKHQEAATLRWWWLNHSSNPINA